MSALTDKEVGELWKVHKDNHDYYTETESSEICALIRKLVDERMRVFQWFDDSQGWPSDWPDFKTKALADFGIDPKTFS